MKCPSCGSTMTMAILDGVCYWACHFCENYIALNKVSVKQNASGYWYVNELTIDCLSIMDGLVLMNRAMTEAEKILAKFNALTDKILAKNKTNSKK